MTGETRASDHDRDIVVRQLREHMARGRLSLSEFQQRMSAALTARTGRERAQLTADLPTNLPPPEPGAEGPVRRTRVTKGGECRPARCFDCAPPILFGAMLAVVGAPAPVVLLGVLAAVVLTCAITRSPAPFRRPSGRQPGPTSVSSQTTDQ